MYVKRAVKVERIRNECQIRLGGPVTPARWKPDGLCCYAQFASSVPRKLRTWNEPLSKSASNFAVSLDQLKSAGLGEAVKSNRKLAQMKWWLIRGFL